MTRDEFMDIANKEINQMLTAHKNRITGLVERAWAEGKKNAEVSDIMEKIDEAIERMHKKPEITTINWLDTHGYTGYIPNACRTCSNHPSNGGSGICHCIMGKEI